MAAETIEVETSRESDDGIDDSSGTAEIPSGDELGWMKLGTVCLFGFIASLVAGVALTCLGLMNYENDHLAPHTYRILGVAAFGACVLFLIAACATICGCVTSTLRHLGMVPKRHFGQHSTHNHHMYELMYPQSQSQFTGLTSRDSAAAVSGYSLCSQHTLNMDCNSGTQSLRGTRALITLQEKVDHANQNQFPAKNDAEIELRNVHHDHLQHQGLIRDQQNLRMLSKQNADLCVPPSQSWHLGMGLNSNGNDIDLKSTVLQQHCATCSCSKGFHNNPKNGVLMDKNNSTSEMRHLCDFHKSRQNSVGSVANRHSAFGSALQCVEDFAL